MGEQLVGVKSIKVKQNLEAGLKNDKYARYATRLRQMDKDGDGNLDIDEICEAIDQMVAQEKQNQLLKKLAIIFAAISLVTIACVAGLTAAIVILSKDTKVSDGVIQAKDGGKGSFLSTGAVRHYHNDAASLLLSLTTTNASSLHSLMLPCHTCGSEGSTDIYTIQRVKIHTPGKLVAAYTGSEVIVADADVVATRGLLTFNSSSTAEEYFQAGSDAASGDGTGVKKRRSLLMHDPDEEPMIQTGTGATIGTTSSEPQLTITPTTSYSISWKGDVGYNIGSAVPTASGAFTNVALASKGAVPIGSSELKYNGYHLKTNINDGSYSNDKGWIAAATDSQPWIGVAWSTLSSPKRYQIDSISFGRDNRAAGTAYTDRTIGNYKIQITENIEPSSNLPDGVTNPTQGWVTIGTIAYSAISDPFRAYQRHTYALGRTVNGVQTPILATGVRIKVSDNRICIDELEVYGKQADPPPPIAVDVAAGAYHTAVLKSDGTVVGWGLYYYQIYTPPTGLSGVIAIAAGYWHTLALKSDGTVVAWGGTDKGQADVPQGLSGVKAIAAGKYHSLALKNDGTVVAWGTNTDGQIWQQPDLPASLSGVKAIAAGGLHSAAVKSDGTVVVWGNKQYLQSSVPQGLSGVKAIAAGAYHTLAVKSDGTVAAWGRDGFGQSTPRPGLSGVKAVAGGFYHSLALKTDGTVVGWGSGAGSSTTWPGMMAEIRIPASIQGVTRAIAAGEYHSVAVLNNGTVAAWGCDDYCPEPAGCVSCKGVSNIPASLNIS